MVIIWYQPHLVSLFHFLTMLHQELVFLVWWITVDNYQGWHSFHSQWYDTQTHPHHIPKSKINIKCINFILKMYSSSWFDKNCRIISCNLWYLLMILRFLWHPNTWLNFSLLEFLQTEMKLWLWLSYAHNSQINIVGIFGAIVSYTAW